MNEIYISKPYIEKSGDNLYRLNANINVAGREEIVFVEVEESYKDYLVVERADAFVFLSLPIALREGFNIRCEVPVTEMFLHNINSILIPALVKGDARAKSIEVIAPLDDVKIESKCAVGASVTCGVDSTYTIMEYSQDKYVDMRLSHLVVGSVSMDLWDFEDNDNLTSWEEKHLLKFQRYYKVSEYTGLPLVKVFTNFVYFISNRRKTNPSYRHLYNHTFITLGTILTLRKLFGVYIYSSTYDYSHFNLKDNLSTDPSDYELLLMHVLSNPEFMCFSGGAPVDRVEKTLALAEYPLAQKILHPCFKNGKKNCSLPTCSKCMRGLFTLDYYDKLDNMASVFDIEKYRNNKQEYLEALTKLKDNTYFSRLYGMFMEKYPKEMKTAQDSLDMSNMSVSKEEFSTLLRAYNTVMLLLSENDPQNTIINYFRSKNIKKLYFVGHSRLGNKIVKLIEKDIEVITLKTGDVNSCDAIFIGSISDREITKIKRTLRVKVNKKMNIYTITDFYNALKTMDV